MVSSRCVAGLSIGMRAFSATATQIKASNPRPSETRNPTGAWVNSSAMVDSWVVPATSAIVNTIRIMAGSASEAISISRDDPIPPNAVPTSMPASASANRAVPMSATITIRSADQENSRLVQ